MKKLSIVLLILTLLLTACAQATESPATPADIEVTQATIYVPGGDAMSGMEITIAGFMQIKNNGSTADRLIGTSADFGVGMIHETKMENDVMSMNMVSGIEIPAGGMVELKSGGYHLMFSNVKQAPKVGDTVNLTLEFEKAGRIIVSAKVTDGQ